ncbi:MAG: hypothetical protein ACI9W6_000239 [Motiliproteus sp.]|jgi:hypothetical protein
MCCEQVCSVRVIGAEVGILSLLAGIGGDLSIARNERRSGWSGCCECSDGGVWLIRGVNSRYFLIIVLKQIKIDFGGFK